MLTTRSLEWLFEIWSSKETYLPRSVPTTATAQNALLRVAPTRASGIAIAQIAQTVKSEALMKPRTVKSEAPINPRTAESEALINAEL